jgi:hypothetical protein
MNGQRLRQWVLALAKLVGPVAGAVHGELSKPEVVRSLTKAVVVGAATRASMFATVRDPEFLTDVVVPLAAAAFTGVLDALSRLQQGEPKPTDAPTEPPQPPSQPT